MSFAKLKIAIENNDILQAALALKVLPDINIEHPKFDGHSVLIHAISKSTIEMVEFLLNHGANPNSVNDHLVGLPLHFALHRDYDVVKLLIDHGANVNAQNIFGNFGLHVAVLNPRSLNMVRLLLDSGAEVNAQSIDGTTAISMAANHGNTDMVSLLLSYGADPYIKDEDGSTALDMSRNTSTLELLKKGASL